MVLSTYFGVDGALIVMMGKAWRQEPEAAGYPQQSGTTEQTRTWRRL